MSMSLVTGEDSESDEEINTDQLGDHTHRIGKRTSGQSKDGIVAGEDDEEEDEDSVSSNVKQYSTKRTESQDSLDGSPSLARKWEPPSLLHKKLGDANYSLRKNLVIRVLQLYHLTCRNLTIVNDNLTRAQGIIEKVNANVKKSDQDLEQLKISLDNIFDSSQTLAPNLHIEVCSTTKSTSTKTKITENEN